MTLDSYAAWLQAVSGTFALVTAAIVGLWVYTRFVLERGLVPPSEFNTECSIAGSHQGHYLIQVFLRINNHGASNLIIRNLRVDLHYLDEKDKVRLATEAASFGRIRFERSVRRLVQQQASQEDLGHAATVPTTIVQSEKGELAGRGIVVVPWDTFVQGKTEQVFTYLTALPTTARYVRVWASFEYAQNPSRFQNWTVKLSRRLGLIQYSLKHISKPHTAERLFSVQERGGVEVDEVSRKSSVPGTAE
jgi:hypothetical protein